MPNNIEPNSQPTDNIASDEPKIVETDLGNEDGQTKCPQCGSTDISTNVNTGKLRCNFCRHEFEPEKVTGLVEDISQLEGQVLGSGAQDIVADTKDIVTFKCSSCGAEVVVDTASALQARCHWCRNTLSVNEQIPNGSVPDVVLPFNVPKDAAKLEIEKFVGKRKFFANPKFKKEFTTNNIMGVYFPYMIVDVNAHAVFIGDGEHEVRSYYLGSGDNQKKYYDADFYKVRREFDITIKGLSIESNSARLNNTSANQTNNVINAIMPFDTENCVKYDANFLKGYTSEKRDVNVSQLSEIVNIQSKDIARFATNATLRQYDRGVAWSTQDLNIKGQQWQAAYLPVWLYSYLEVKGNKKILHYVAVNARTKETMGSVPIHMPKLLVVSCLIEFLGLLAMLNIDWDYNWIFLLSGVIFFIIIYGKYRNRDARHTYERETKNNMTNIQKVDQFVTKRTRLSSSQIEGANNTRVDGEATNSKLFSSIIGNKKDLPK